MLFYDLILSVLLTTVLLVSTGFIVYKKGRADSWEHGIAVFMLMVLHHIRSLFRGLTKIFRYSCEFAGKVYQWWKKSEPTYHALNESLALTPSEATEFIKRLSVRPYITPARKRFGVDNGVWILEIKALGLQQRYSAMSPAEIREMAVNIFTEMVMDMRGEVPNFYIPVATAHRILLFIPLSQYGFDFLQRKIEEFEKTQDDKLATNKCETEPLTEEVPDIPDSLDVKCDSDI